MGWCDVCGVCVELCVWGGVMCVVRTACVCVCNVVLWCVCTKLCVWGGVTCVVCAVCACVCSVVYV